MKAKARFVGTLKRGDYAFDVKVYSLFEEKKIKSQYYHRNCGEKIQNKFYCPKHNIIDFQEVERGWLLKDEIIYLNSKDLEELKINFPQKEIIVIYEQNGRVFPFFKNVFLVFPDKSEKSYFAYLEYLWEKNLFAVSSLLIACGRKKEKIYACIFPEFFFGNLFLFLGILPFKEEIIHLFQLIEDIYIDKYPEKVLEIEAEKQKIKEGKIEKRKINNLPLFSNEEWQKMNDLLSKKNKKKRGGDIFE